MFSQALTAFAFIAVVQASTYTVTVGIDETNGHQGLGFDPSTIVPAVGDTITFTFQLPGYIKDPQAVQHSATQSTFEDPCTPKAGGFDTGVQTTGSENTHTGSSFNLMVNDTQPLWFFSSVGSDCKSGMVFSVNPPTTGEQTAAAFKAAAMASSGSSGSSSTPVTPTSSASDASSSGSQTGSSQSAAPSTTSPAPEPTGSNGALIHNSGLGFAVAVAAAMGVVLSA